MWGAYIQQRTPENYHDHVVTWSASRCSLGVTKLMPRRRSGARPTSASQSHHAAHTRRRRDWLNDVQQQQQPAAAPNYCHIQSCSIKYALSSHLPAVAPAVDSNFIRSTFPPLPHTPLYNLIFGTVYTAILVAANMVHIRRQNNWLVILRSSTTLWASCQVSRITGQSNVFLPGTSTWDKRRMASLACWKSRKGFWRVNSRWKKKIIFQKKMANKFQ